MGLGKTSVQENLIVIIKYLKFSDIANKGMNHTKICHQLILNVDLMLLHTSNSAGKQRLFW